MADAQRRLAEEERREIVLLAAHALQGIMTTGMTPSLAGKEAVSAAQSALGGLTRFTDKQERAADSLINELENELASKDAQIERLSEIGQVPSVASQELQDALAAALAENEKLRALGTCPLHSVDQDGKPFVPSPKIVETYRKAHEVASESLSESDDPNQRALVNIISQLMAYTNGLEAAYRKVSGVMSPADAKCWAKFYITCAVVPGRLPEAIKDGLNAEDLNLGDGCTICGGGLGCGKIPEA